MRSSRSCSCQLTYMAQQQDTYLCRPRGAIEQNDSQILKLCTHTQLTSPHSQGSQDGWFGGLVCTWVGLKELGFDEIFVIQLKVK